MYSPHNYHHPRDNLHTYKGVVVHYSMLQENKASLSRCQSKREELRIFLFPSSCISLSLLHCIRAANKGNTHLVTAESKDHFTKNEHTDIMIYLLIPQLQVQIHGIIAPGNPEMQTTRLPFSRTLTPKTNHSVINLLHFSLSHSHKDT